MCNYQFSTPRGITKPAYRTPNKQHDAAGLIRLASPPLYIAITQSPPLVTDYVTTIAIKITPEIDTRREQ